MNIDKVLIVKVGGQILVDYKELHPFQGKLKSITKDDYHKLIQSLKKNGMPVALNIWIDSKGKKWISDGHHRCLAFGDMEKDGWFIPPMPCNVVKAKTKKEAAALLLIGNSTYAHITQESLSDYMINEDLSLPDLEFLDLPDLDMSAFDLENGETNESADDPESAYTDKIESPIYTPKGPKPQITELYDKSKTDKLIAEIESSNLSKDEKEFLKLAAQRHIVFNYQNVAEYYSHSDKSTQDLMENSALVIIDYKKAIELGFVKLTKDLAEAYNDDAE